MDEEKREHRMDYPEDMEIIDEDRMDEEVRDTRRDYQEDSEGFIEDPLEEGMRERPREHQEDMDILAEDRADEEMRAREPASRMREEAPRERDRSSMDRELVPLLNAAEAEEFRSRWLDIQADFVDDPRHSVESADELVARVINSITENFASERNTLEDQWNRGEEASTEDLRIAIKRYRSFFNRLLTLESAGTQE